MELLENRLLMDALCCLRNDITPLKYDTARVHKLSSYVMCGTAEELRSVADWPGVDGKSRELLMDNLQGVVKTDLLLVSISFPSNLLFMPWRKWVGGQLPT